MRTGRFVVVFVLVAQLFASAAWAKDFCIYFSLFAIAAQDFTIPGKGKCKPLVGVFGRRDPLTNAFTSEGDVVSGTACTNTAKTALRIGFTVHPGTLGEGDDGGDVFIGQTNIALPELAGGATAFRAIQINGSIVALGPVPTEVGTCVLPNTPVP